MVDIRIEGYAVVSEDGMIADASGKLPPALIAQADQRFFEQGLDGVDVVVNGRHSEEAHANSSHRHRIVVTRKIAGIDRAPTNARAVLWNPEGASFEDAVAALKIPCRSAGIVGGTEVFGHFLPLYDVFYLSRIADVLLAGGRPVFPQVPNETPETVMKRSGLRDEGPILTDVAARLTISRWRRLR